ncbi:MAG: hypothetical protein GY719_21490 [bacterium]|nr:hypothetical protein [bacterium]
MTFGRRLRNLVIGAGCLSAAAVAEPPPLPCDRVDGLPALLEPGTVAIFGEVHGTAEAPAFFSDVVCGSLAAGHAVTAGLELPPSLRPAIDAFLDSEGTPEDRASLLAGGFWQSSYQDGRASEATVALIDSFRRHRRAGYPLEVRLFDQAGSSSQARDRAMADRLRTLIEASSSDLFIALTGNVHARMAPGTRWDDGYEPMAYLAAATIPERRWIALDLGSSGGTAWICSGGEDSSCKARRLSGRYEGTSRGIVLRAELDGQPYHGFYHVGELNASLPAAGGDTAPEPDSSQPP